MNLLRRKLCVFLTLLVGALSVADAGVEEIEAKLDSIRIPRYEVEAETLAFAIEEVRRLAREHDAPEVEVPDRGVPIAVEKRVPLLVTLRMENATVREILTELGERSGRDVDVGGRGVFLWRGGIIGNPGELVTRVYPVPPNCIDPPDRMQFDDPFAPPRPEPGIRKRLTARERLESFGVSFPEGAWVRSGDGSQLVVRNTPENHELIEIVLLQLVDEIGRKRNRVRVRAEVYELSRAEALALQRAAGGGRSGAECSRMIDEWFEEGRATLVALPSLVTKSGQRAKIEMGREQRVLMGYAAKDGKDVAEIEMVQVGLQLEVDPFVRFTSDSIDLNLALSLTRGEPEMGRRTIRLPVSGEEAEIDTIRLPQAKLVTALSLSDGQPVFAGIVNETGGEPDDPRFLAVIVAASVERPMSDEWVPE